MKGYLKGKISAIVDGKLTDTEIEELINIFRYMLEESVIQDDDQFFKDLAFEMGGSVKELALLIIEFRKDLKSRVDPEITDLTMKYIPQAADQLEAIIETTEMAANKIMDNLEVMQEQAQFIQGTVNFLRAGKIIVPNGNKEVVETKVNKQTVKAVAPLMDYIEQTIQNYLTIISDLFVQMSFQDLTGQRIRRIMTLVNQMETKLKKMIVSFGIKVVEREKNPDITAEALQEAVAEKVTELAGPQRVGCGLDQAGIDELLINI
jgi:chemotaxis protein CheZ